MIEDDGDLSAAGSAALAAALTGALAQGASATERPVDEALLVRYLAGALSDEDAEALEGALIRQTAARRALASVADRLDALTNSQEAMDARAAAGDAVAHAARALAEERLRGAQRGAGLDWEALRARADAGAQAAWVALQAALARWRAAPAPAYAVARGSAATLLFETTPEGGLRVTATGLSGDAATLFLAGEGESWPLATAPVEGGRARWHLPGFGAALGLAPGEALPTGRLQVNAADAGTPSLLLERAEGAPVAIAVVDGPRVAAGRLTLTLRIPSEIAPSLAGQSLRVGIRLGEGVEAPLGVLQPEAMAAASGGDMRIDLLYPGLPDGEMRFLSLLTLRLTNYTGIGYHVVSATWVIR